MTAFRAPFLSLVLLFLLLAPASAWAKLQVVVTCSSYEPIVEYLGGDHVEVMHLVEGYQDPHIVRPKPSLAVHLAKADLFVETGLDLEAWVPALVDQAGNPDIRSGQKGFVSVSTGVKVIEVPSAINRAEGDVHLFGNPHIHTSPINGKIIAENIATGLKRVDPAHAAEYDANLARFKAEIDTRLYGSELVRMVGSATLDRLAQSGRLVAFLESQTYQGRSMSSYLGGWMAQAAPLRGRKLVNFHKNWGYFVDLFGIQVVGYMEPKPGLPPSPGHITSLVDRMQHEDVRVIFDANYFDPAKMRLVADRTGAVAVQVGLAVGGQSGMDDFFDQFDIWIATLLDAYKRAGVIS
ncbi:MAG: zinc ABC transporter substrate-binding protein [Deltaproteobacteria bacterium]|nr:zinc ABC transporter substrate-binding protein [Deltaproteobacteria bacterium]